MTPLELGHGKLAPRHERLCHGHGSLVCQHGIRWRARRCMEWTLPFKDRNVAMASVIHMYCWLRTYLDSDQSISADIQGVQGVLGESRDTKGALDESGRFGVISYAMWLGLSFSEDLSRRGGVHQSKEASCGGV